MSHDMEIAGLMRFAEAEGVNPAQRALLRQCAERLEWCDEQLFNAGKTTEALAASQREREQLQARVEAAEKLMRAWRVNGSDPDIQVSERNRYAELADDLETALASPPAAPVQAEGEG